MPRTIGLPKMNKEAGERRAFLPAFIQFLVKAGFKVTLEKDYGSKLGRTFADYKQGISMVLTGNRKQTFSQEYALILRAPNQEDLELIGEKTCLLSMLHYDTRPKRIKRLKQSGIDAISLDAIKDDQGRRLVENVKAVAWNAMDIAYSELEKKNPNLIRQNGKAWNVLILGTGMVGKQAVDAASNLGSRYRNKSYIENGGAGVVVSSIGRNASKNKRHIRELLSNTNILIDATKRHNASKAIIPNDWLAALPKEALIVDLTVDPYILSTDPPVVKSIEGIPGGNLNKYIFEVDDEEWEEEVPSQIPSTIRRKTISCYSWPGIYPEDCMKHYGKQLKPMMRILERKDYSQLSLKGDYFERALYRAKLDSFIKK